MIFRTWSLLIKRNIPEHCIGDTEYRFLPSTYGFKANYPRKWSKSAYNFAYLVSTRAEWDIVWGPSDKYVGPKCIVNASRYIVSISGTDVSSQFLLFSD